MKSKLRFVIGLLAVLFLAVSCASAPGTVDGAQAAGEVQAAAAIPENTVRVHYQRTDGNYENYVLWIWNDTTWESDGGWPNGLEKAGVDSYGAYYDVPVKSDAMKLGMVVVEKTLGDAGKDGGDKIIDFNFPAVRELWLVEGSDEVMLTKPVQIPENTLRVHYTRDDGNYENYVLWIWNDTTWESADGWPEGLPKTGIDEFGAYYDIPLKEGASQVGFLAVDRTLGDSGKDGGDKSFAMLDQYNRVWIRQGDDEVYVTPSYAKPVGIVSATVASNSSIKATFISTQGLKADDLVQDLAIEQADGTMVIPSGVEVKADGKTIEISLPIDIDLAPYTVTYDEKTVTATVGWQYVDGEYAYDGELGPFLQNDGSALLKMWSPMVARVSVVLYDKDDQDRVIRDDIPMTKGDDGVWSVVLDSGNTGVSNLRGYYYHYKVDASGDGNTRLALDPYAKSMAPFNNAIYEIGKGAITADVAAIGPRLEYASIPGFTKEEDAIIWEAHVRDLTVDPSIEGELSAPFGTFQAIIDRLEYIQSLGVTHIQLLPVMSYKWGDDYATRQREMEYSAKDNNYNWGYDPHSYFSLSGMYSENPDDPERRIEEFKALVQAIHDRGMGVILDVVFNHTADLRIFEDLAPGYYHFMDADGTPRTSFGGGRLGTTHAMSRKVMVDALSYWTREFKVDGFRFDMMGDHDAESVQAAYDAVKALNPNIVVIGEGWRTYAGDAGDPRQPADQDWMAHTDGVAVFSDEIRNELKSGFGSEGQPRFITGGPRNIQQIFDNIKAQPHNFTADDPGDVVPYIAAHDNLTLHDVIAQSIRKDPDVPENNREIHQRIRIGNAMVLTSQGVAFIHAGQEYGRTKQWRAPGKPEHKDTRMTNRDGSPFAYPYFVHDSYDSSDIINMFDWAKATDPQAYPENNLTRAYTAGLISLRRSTDAFRLGTKELVEANVQLLDIPEVRAVDLVLPFSAKATNGDVYYVFINADTKVRTLSLDQDLRDGTVVVDNDEAGPAGVADPSGFRLGAGNITLDPLTVVIVRK
ncbi:pullulanase [Spirochaeta lutea]|uniref:pullulanase n=1 Tax=Spirochaeta lutea TaxID=1480694 RepID=UPI00069066CF|nr:pullulanase [Spirochaeta lutea]